jgi:hypothetical protein
MEQAGAHLISPDFPIIFYCDTDRTMAGDFRGKVGRSFQPHDGVSEKKKNAVAAANCRGRRFAFFEKVRIRKKAGFRISNQQESGQGSGLS